MSGEANPPTAVDVLIIGAGPVGLFAVFECGMLKLHCHVVDTFEAIGGQCTALYPDKPIYDIPGFPRIGAGELVDNLAEQAAPFRPTYHLGQTVRELRTLAGGTIEARLSGGSKIVAKAVIIAAGGGTLGPNRPPLAGIERYEGRHVIYRVGSLEALRGRRVVVAGGGDSAVDWTLALLDVAARVMLVHRRARFRATPASVQALLESAQQGKLELVTPFQLHGLEGDDDVLHAVTVKDDTGGVRRLDADTLLALFGIATELGPIADWNLHIDHQQIVIDPATSETSRPGIYAIGDVTVYPGKLKLILSGFAEAAIVAHAIYKRMHPGEVLHFEHSTTAGVPPREPTGAERATAVAGA